jgi:formyl-CoA transferase
MMALYERERTGEGRWVHTSLLESMVFMLDLQAARYLMDGEVPGQAGNDHPVNIPMGAFETADKPVNIAASSPRMWAQFAEALGHPEWLEVEEWKTARGRSDNRKAVNAAIAAVMKQKPAEHWIELLERIGIPCGPINRVDEVFADPQVRHLRMAMPIRHPERGETHLVSSAINMEGVESEVWRLPPRLGEHSAEILREAGYSDEEIARLRGLGVITGA